LRLKAKRNPRPDYNQDRFAAQRRSCTPINPRPGIAITLILSYPYLSNSLKSFHRSTDHDVVLAAALTLLWGTIFFWHTIGRKWPRVRLAIESLLGLMILSGMAALYRTVIYLILKK